MDQKTVVRRKENLKPVILQSQSTDELIEIIKDRTSKQVTAADVEASSTHFTDFIGS